MVDVVIASVVVVVVVFIVRYLHEKWHKSQKYFLNKLSTANNFEVNL